MITRETLLAAVGAGNVPSSDYDLTPDFARYLPENRVLRAASVLVPVVGGDKGLQVVLTKRASHLKHHPGQVAFPGGKLEQGETVIEAALREAEEEIALPRGAVDILGVLGPHETVTNFTVTPVVAMVADFTPHPHAGEVEEVFKVPLDFLMDPANMTRQARIWQGHLREYYTIPYGPYYIWGATARMIKGLADRVALCR